MVMAMSAIANDGVMMKPLLVKSLQDAEGKTVTHFSTGPGTRIISSQAAKDTVTALKTVPTKEGTAIKAALDYYTVAGKTGTAQIPNGDRGYLEGVYVSSFCGFFPADNPELCLYIMLNKVDRAKGGYYGGQVAAPIFKRVAEQAAQHLKIRPDKEGSFQDALAASTNGNTPPPARTP
jgi:cell division protein FtsI/penicillin-binding protein 2